MAESKYISIPTSETNNTTYDMHNSSSVKGETDDTDVITLNILTMYNNDNNSTSMPQTRSTATTTPTISTTKRLFSRKPKNLHLKISSPSVETENDSLSSDKFKSATATTTRNNSTSSTTPSTSTATTTSNSIFPHEQNRTSKKLNIGFENIRYTAHMGFFRRDTKNILKGITGQFKAGELSAIVGPSGAGKSTCLNILSGYTAFGYSGDVTVNDYIRDIKTFKPNVAFITQDTSLHPYLTVKEAMHFSANLKIGTHMSKCAKRERVKKILEAIGMYENRHTRTSQLSGGQLKRLSVALELVNNPPVLILDEPTSGLDSSTSNQLISLLKKLALEGRTVICTIHQPSALTFEMFDHLYAIADGCCIYSGGTQNLVPFLADVGLPCPESYNPADYLMEIATDDYGQQNEKLIAKIENGRNNNYRQTKAARKKQLEAMQKVDKMMAAGLMTPVMAPIFTPACNSNNSSPAPNGHCPTATYPNHSNHYTKPLTPIKEMSSRIGNSKGILNESNDNSTTDDTGCCKQLESPKLCKSENIYATPFYRQLGILLLRTFLILWRDKSLTTIRFIIHLVTALLIGCLYYGIGNQAENALNNFRYCFYSIMFIMYSAFSSILVKFPLEFPIVSREHFNRWYSLRAYYVAITLADIPIQFVCTSVYIVITYILTDQPRDVFRVVLFCVIIFLTALVGQSIGLAVGASLNIKLAAILGPFFICPFLAFSGFFLQEKHTPEPLQWIFKTSFLKYSLDASVLSIFGFDRPRLECNAMYCHYSRPKVFLKDVDMLNASYETAIIFLVCLFLALRIISFYIMSFRLRLFR
ncbi:ATP-binding cassette sub-family G member 1 [Lucilia sericata]|uniref:ATP-binding cassette sub-family G member 1 n=1 Tax=Lucilia sericata TaxID=13632 RepID=UPI0018A7FCE0|nr:ATP-binding cassette sub-family G member 1 [Lucilia sericata]